MATTPRKTRTTPTASADAPAARKRKAADTTSTAASSPRPRATRANTAAPRSKPVAAAAPSSDDAAPAPAPVRKLRARGPATLADDAPAPLRSRTLTTPAASTLPPRKPRAKPAAEVTVPDTPRRHRAKVGDAIDAEPAGAKPRRARKASSGPTPAEQVEQLKLTTLGALEDLKARELLILDVRQLTSMFDFRIIVTGTSNRHLSAMAEEVAKRAKAIGMPPMYISGDRESDWVLVDLGDIVVDLMSDQARTRYALEKLWQVPAAPPVA